MRPPADAAFEPERSSAAHGAAIARDDVDAAGSMRPVVAIASKIQRASRARRQRRVNGSGGIQVAQRLVRAATTSATTSATAADRHPLSRASAGWRVLALVDAAAIGEREQTPFQGARRQRGPVPDHRRYARVLAQSEARADEHNYG